MNQNKLCESLLHIIAHCPTKHLESYRKALKDIIVSVNIENKKELFDIIDNYIDFSYKVDDFINKERYYE